MGRCPPYPQCPPIPQHPMSHPTHAWDCLQHPITLPITPSQTQLLISTPPHANWKERVFFVLCLKMTLVWKYPHLVINSLLYCYQECKDQQLEQEKIKTRMHGKRRNKELKQKRENV